MALLILYYLSPLLHGTLLYMVPGETASACLRNSPTEVSGMAWLGPTSNGVYGMHPDGIRTLRLISLPFDLLSIRARTAIKCTASAYEPSRS